MRRRVAVVAVASLLLALGAAVAVWASVRGGGGTACPQPLVTVADPGSGKMMTYRPREDCSVPGDAGK